MFMSRRLPLLVLAGLGVVPPGTAPSPDQPVRVVAQRDTSFVVPDSVAALLSYPTALAVDSGGTLYLADNSLSAVLKFDARGQFLGALGRRGSGPGELYSAFMVGLHRDSLWVMDPALNRLTLFPLRGRGVVTVPFGASVRALEASNRARLVSGLPVTIMPDGSLLFQEALRDSSSATGGYTEGILLRASRGLEVLDTLLRYPMTHSVLVFVYRDGELHMTQPFGDDPLYAVSRDGATLVSITRPAAERDGPSEFTVTMWENGKELYSRAVEYTPRRLRRRAVDSASARIAGTGGRDQPNSPITADSIRRRMYQPAFYPPVQELKVAHDGSVWLRVNFGDGPVEGAEWLQLSRRGFVQSRAVLPDRFKLLEAERRQLWGYVLDADDVPVLTKFVLPRAPTL